MQVGRCIIDIDPAVGAIIGAEERQKQPGQGMLLQIFAVWRSVGTSQTQARILIGILQYRKRTCRRRHTEGEADEDGGSLPISGEERGPAVWRLCLKYAVWACGCISSPA